MTDVNEAAQHVSYLPDLRNKYPSVLILCLLKGRTQTGAVFAAGEHPSVSEGLGWGQKKSKTTKTPFPGSHAMTMQN